MHIKNIEQNIWTHNQLYVCDGFKYTFTRMYKHLNC